MPKAPSSPCRRVDPLRVPFPSPPALARRLLGYTTRDRVPGHLRDTVSPCANRDKARGCGSHLVIDGNGGRRDSGPGLGTEAHCQETVSSVATLEKSNRRLATELRALQTNIQTLERSQQRYKAQLKERAENTKDTKAELEAARMHSVIAEEKLDEMEDLVQALVKDLHRFRSWWYTEYLSLQALLELVPNRADVEAIASSANDRFRVYSDYV